MKVPPAAESNESLAPDFLDFVTLLNEHEVDYVLVGGYALAVHGVIRATSDIDFLYRRTKANVNRLCDALDAFGAPANVIDAKVLMTPETVTMFGAPPLRIDLLSDISGVEYEKVRKGSIVQVISSQPLRVIGMAELCANKKSTGRKKDLEDVRLLKKANKTPRRK